jgi:hypothetical protein
MEPDADDLERLRALLRAMLGHPEPEPQQGNIVPSEGGNPAPPGISAEQYARDFIRRLNGTTAAYAEQLPED